MSLPVDGRWFIGTEPLALTVFEIFGPTNVNERTSQPTNRQQTRRIAIPRNGCNNSVEMLR